MRNALVWTSQILVVGIAISVCAMAPQKGSLQAVSDHNVLRVAHILAKAQDVEQLVWQPSDSCHEDAFYGPWLSDGSCQQVHSAQIWALHQCCDEEWEGQGFGNAAAWECVFNGLPPIVHSMAACPEMQPQ